MTEHEPLWKPEVKSGAPEEYEFPAPHAAPVNSFFSHNDGVYT